MGNLAVAAQPMCCVAVTVLPYWFGFGVRHGQKTVLNIGMATRYLGAALTPLPSTPASDQRSIAMVVLGSRIVVACAFLATTSFGHEAGSGSTWLLHECSRPAHRKVPSRLSPDRLRSTYIRSSHYATDSRHVPARSFRDPTSGQSAILGT
jgi:hypothetical protein